MDGLTATDMEGYLQDILSAPIDILDFPSDLFLDFDRLDAPMGSNMNVVLTPAISTDSSESSHTFAIGSGPSSRGR